MLHEVGPTWNIVKDTGRSVARICPSERDTIKDVKILVSKISGIELDQLYLSYRNRLLLDSDGVSAVGDGEEVTLLSQPPAPEAGSSVATVQLSPPVDCTPPPASTTSSVSRLKFNSNHSKYSAKDSNCSARSEQEIHLHVSDQYQSISQAILALPKSGGGCIEILEEDFDFAEAVIYIDRPDVCLYHPEDLPPLRVPKHLMVFKNAVNFRMVNIEVDLLIDPFNNLVGTPMTPLLEERTSLDDKHRRTRRVREGSKDTTSSIDSLSYPSNKLSEILLAEQILMRGLGDVAAEIPMSNPQERTPPQSLEALCYGRTSGEVIFPSDSSGCRSVSSGSGTKDDLAHLVRNFTGCSEGKAVRALALSGGSPYAAAKSILDQRICVRKALANAPKPYEKMVPFGTFVKSRCDSQLDSPPLSQGSSASGERRPSIAGNEPRTLQPPVAAKPSPVHVKPLSRYMAIMASCTASICSVLG